MRLTALNSTCIGENHLRRGKVCQDASLSLNESSFVVAAVSDGHGGDKYFRSDLGAKFLVDAAQESAIVFMENISEDDISVNNEKMLSQLAKSIISAWNERVEHHFADNPFNEDEIKTLPEETQNRYKSGYRIESAYGATLLLVAATEKFWFGLQIGDGKCVVKSIGKGYDQPIPWDDKCILNVTTSISDKEAISNFRYYFGEEIPLGIFIASDGIDDCFANDEQLYAFYDALFLLFGQYDLDGAKQELSDYLPKMSAKGSGDDMSVAALLDIEAIKLLWENKDTCQFIQASYEIDEATDISGSDKEVQEVNKEVQEVNKEVVNKEEVHKEVQEVREVNKASEESKIIEITEAAEMNE